MALCDTKIYTDSSDISGGQPIPEILDGKRSRKRESKTSPRLGKRRSTRIRKRDAGDEFSENGCYSSDDSDPNIHVGDTVLMDEEEKLMMKDESDLVTNQSAEKQLIAVALVKSVIDKHKNDDQRKDVKKKEAPGANTVNKTADLQKVKKEMDKTIPTVKAEHNSIIQSKVVNDLGGISNSDTNNVNPSNLNLNAVNDSDTKITRLPTTTSQPLLNNNKASTQRSTRSRSKGAKGGRTMALKGAYASIREAPRIVMKPSVAVPVPNPILPSPVTNEVNKANINAKLNQVGKIENKIQPNQTAPIIKKDESSNSTENPKMTQGIVKSAKPTSNAISLTIPARHPGNPNKQQANRRRIFSIDLDSEDFDLDMGMCASPPPDIVDSISALPPIISSSSATDSKNLTTQIAPIQPTNISVTAEDTSLQGGRDRGMSFELFSFTQHESLVDLNDEALNGGRPRGDSIIFDPVSFSDGNEEAAFQRLQQHLAAQNIGANGTESINTPPLFDNNSSQFQPNIQLQSNNVAPPKATSNQNHSRSRSAHTRSNKSARNSNSNGSTYLRQSKSSTLSHTKSKSISYSGNHFPHSDDTIHMPQGSAAAAAAAASLSSQVVPYSVNGTISHTACPMELLNKGGRIGIYLPEARRERIAKFHSKRKNRIWRKRIKYDCRKKLADSRPRIKGRFVKSLEE